MAYGYKNDPRELEARFDGVCAETGKPIFKGDMCVYYPGGRYEKGSVYHVDSDTAQKFREWAFDIAMGADY